MRNTSTGPSSANSCSWLPLLTGDSQCRSSESQSCRGSRPPCMEAGRRRAQSSGWLVNSTGRGTEARARGSVNSGPGRLVRPGSGSAAEFMADSAGARTSAVPSTAASRCHSGSLCSECSGSRASGFNDTQARRASWMALQGKLGAARICAACCARLPGRMSCERILTAREEPRAPTCTM